MQNTIYLVVNPDTEFAWQVPVKEGVNSIGREKDCDVFLDDESILNRHAEIHLIEGQAVLMDLSQGNPTPIDLMPQSPFMLGNVHLKLAASRDLKDFAPQQDSQMDGISPDEADTPAFVKGIADAFAYPLRGDGLYVVICGAVVFALCDLAVRYSLLGFVISLGILGFLSNYAKEIIKGTVVGQDSSAQWPDFSGWYDDIVVPAFELVAVCILSLGLGRVDTNA